MTASAAPTSPKVSAVLADVDGTLVTNEKVLTPRAIRAIELLHERGIAFAVTSGRPPRGMRMLVHPLELQSPIAAFNGGVMVQPDMTIMDERSLPPDITTAVIDTLRAVGLYVWIYCGADWYVTDPNAPHAQREASTVQFEPTVVPSYDPLLERVVKIVGVSDDHDAVARGEVMVQEEFGTQVSAARSRPHYLDVTHQNANKGVVIERLSRHYNIPLDQIATLGDEVNDLLMFRHSGLSIAMGNATEEVRRQAACVTLSNEEDGFAHAIEQFVLPRAAAAP